MCSRGAEGICEMRCLSERSCAGNEPAASLSRERDASFGRKSSCAKQTLEGAVGRIDGIGCMEPCYKRRTSEL
jgi:hypothetical protein